MPLGRFVVTLAPFAVLTLLDPDATPRPWRLARWGLALLMLSWLWPLWQAGRDPETRRPNPATIGGELMGRFLEETLPPGLWIAAATAGATPWFAPSHRFVDTLGVNDLHIARREISASDILDQVQLVPAHAKGDGHYVLSREPDIIVLSWGLGSLVGEPAANFLTDMELAEDPRFFERYRAFGCLYRAPEIRFQNLEWVAGGGDPRAARLVVYTRRSTIVSALLEARPTCRTYATGEVRGDRPG
jgi:hypothetical protein